MTSIRNFKAPAASLYGLHAFPAKGAWERFDVGGREVFCMQGDGKHFRLWLIGKVTNVFFKFPNSNAGGYPNYVSVNIDLLTEKDKTIVGNLVTKHGVNCECCG